MHYFDAQGWGEGGRGLNILFEKSIYSSNGIVSKFKILVLVCIFILTIRTSCHFVHTHLLNVGEG
jgi:hypothetical protein